jgi:tubulin-folding cofactor B
MNFEELRSYVTEKDHLQYSNLPPNIVSVSVSHSNLKQKWPELRIDLHTSIGEIKTRLYKHGGTSANMQRLELLPAKIFLDDDTKPLGFYSVQNGMEIRIHDLDPYSLAKQGWIEDTSKINKYVMPDDVYDQRENTVRKQKAAKQQQQQQQLQQQQQQPSITTTKDYSSSYPLNSRCSVGPGDRRGVIKFVGIIPELENKVWIGVDLDEPLGKNDGSIGNCRLFTCNKNHGVFAAPDRVQVGDFPEVLDISSSDEGEM